ncbi:MAG: DUF4405 domain-containing protein [Candidatus Woesearchaeota archaeon]
MDRIKLLYWNDVLMGISFILSGVTGVIKFPGLLMKLGISFQSIPIRTISDVHDWSGLAMVLMVFVHLALHWNWIVCTTKNMFRRKKAQCETS